ncbi:unnamed protein product [Bursaphelenchus xylophilus]|uniref:(pine wood nematode) hypothetical protein n=1 Tax=Bursaphelenchus xylophilus TaxID=6326 RepID=A0A1I7RIC9_BURXY|nr:unnamed protein product [Bursaphelenchus xylophilus]CAG9080929.1 unnamed protein product [Bursaphelenchus xylophilus]
MYNCAVSSYDLYTYCRKEAEVSKYYESKDYCTGTTDDYSIKHFREHAAQPNTSRVRKRTDLEGMLARMVVNCQLTSDFCEENKAEYLLL